MSPGQQITTIEWIKSSYSSSSGGDCLEFSRSMVAVERPGTPYRIPGGGGLPEPCRAITATGTVPVRDSKNPTGPVLAFEVPGWMSFIAALKARRLPST